MTPAPPIFRRLGNMRHMWQLLGLGPAGGNRLCIAYARSYVASVMALAHKRLTEVKYVFDMRGFWNDERLEGGPWPREGGMCRVAHYFAELLRMRRGSRLLVVNRGEHACIRERVAAAGVKDDAVELTSATHAEVPGLMVRMDAGVHFIKPVFSKQALASTKLPVFLGCGVPCLGNAGVGDMADFLEGEAVGIVLRSFDSAALRRGLNELLALAALPQITERCRAAATKHFSLQQGVRRYSLIYAQLEGGAA